MATRLDVSIRLVYYSIIAVQVARDTRGDETMTATTFRTMSVEHLGPDATDADLSEFVAICEEAQRIHPEMDDEAVTESVFGDGDYYRNARRLGVDVDAIAAAGPMTATNNKPVVQLDEIFDAMRDCYRNSLTSGRNWHAVTVGVDGIPYTREEASRCVSESEYFGKVEPHPVTVWSTQGDSSIDADEIESAVDGFDARDQFAGYGGVSELVEKLERAGFSVIL